MMDGVPFTQFLRPDGRRVPIKVDRPFDIEVLAANAIAAGVKFEAEVLTTGEVAFEAMMGKHTIAIEICANGPAVLETVDKLVKRAAAVAERGVGENGMPQL